MQKGNSKGAGGVTRQADLGLAEPQKNELAVENDWQGQLIAEEVKPKIKG